MDLQSPQKKKMNKIIAVDIDDVIADLVTEWLRLYNSDYGDNLVPERITSWGAISSETKCGDKMYEYLNYPKLYSGVLPVEKSFWGINNLRMMGYRVVFATASWHSEKIKWVKDNKFMDNEDDLVITRDKSLVRSSFLIDDRPKNIRDFKDTGILFTKPWNKDFKWDNRCNNWDEVVSYFKKQRSIWD